jgi:hypothetical protein
MDYSMTTKANTELSRPEMIDSARMFFSHPRVKIQPIDVQKQFLLNKGLTDTELNEALIRLGHAKQQVF